MGFQFNPLTGNFDIAGAGASQVQTDWNATTGLAAILNKPSLAAVATSGSAADLTTGILNDARLSSNVALDNLNNPFTQGQTITAPANSSALTASYSVTGANTTALLNLTGTWNTTGAANGILLNITDTASATTSRLLDFQVGGTSRFRVSKSGDITTAQDVYSASAVLGSGIRASSNLSIGFSSSTNPAVAADTTLFRDAANTLAQRSGTAAQTFRLYNSFTDSSNFERGFFRWNSNVLEIGTEAGGTGTARGVRIQIGTANPILFTTSGSGLDVSSVRSLSFGSGLTIGPGSAITGLTAISYASGSADPTTTTLTNGNWQVYRNTTSGTIRLWANNNGTMVSVALA